MKYITAIFYTEKENKTRRDKVVYSENLAIDAVTASEITHKKIAHFMKKNPKIEDAHARTFKLEVPSYDLR